MSHDRFLLANVVADIIGQFYCPYSISFRLYGYLSSLCGVCESITDYSVYELRVIKTLTLDLLVQAVAGMT